MVFATCPRRDCILALFGQRRVGVVCELGRARLGILVVNLFTGHRSPVILPVIFVTTLECPHIVLIVDALMSTIIERVRAYISQEDYWATKGKSR